MKRKALIARLLACAGLAGAASAQTELTMWYHGAGNEVESGSSTRSSTTSTPARPTGRCRRELPAGDLQRLRRRRGAGRQPARHPRHRRAEHAELGMVGLHAAAADRRERDRRTSCPAPTASGTASSIRSACGTPRSRSMRASRRSTSSACARRRWTSPGPARSSWPRSTRPRSRGKFEYPLDLGMNDQGEWYPYAFSPFLQ